ncbi:MAG TPA: ComEC/Rec2 family competence protein [Candidatus Udaeobacter sp.]|nr:ComEC/Rec2 family competence protein [Candidatus Udaeobacter sp.]
MTRYTALVLSLAWCVAIGGAVVLVPGEPALGVLAVALAVPCAATAAVLRPAIVALAVAAALLAVARVELPATNPEAALRAHQMAGATATVIGRVADDSKPVGGGSEVLVEPSTLIIGSDPINDFGNLMVRWRGPAQVGPGDQVQATGKLTLPRDLPSFDRRAYLSQRQVYLQMTTTSLNVTSPADGIGALPAWLRDHYTSGLNDALPPPHSSVLLGIVLGIKQGIPAGLQKALIATGLVHLLVLSGLKVAVFARIVQGALQPLLRRWAMWPALALIGLYAMVGGAPPAAVRATAMGGLAIAASHLGRPTHVWTSLALTAAAMLGWRPELAWDVGFQLSFAGTAAIILLAPSIAGRVRFLPPFLREPFAVTCAAQVGTLPMMASDFHVLSPVGPIANALTLPILPVLVTAGLVMGALSFAPDAARVAAIPIAGLLAYVEQVAYVLSRVPAASVSIPTFPAWAGLAYYSALGPAIAGVQSRGRPRRLAFVGAIAAPLVISATALVAWANAPPEAVVMNVGDGQAVLLRGPQGALLIDGGPSPATLASELGTHLPPWERNLDALVITSPGLGHIGGLAGFDRAASTVVIPDAALTGSAWRTVTLDEVARGAIPRKLRGGMWLSVAGFKLQAISPEPGAPGDQPGAADLAIRAVAPDGRSFCDLSDLDVDAQTVAATRLQGSCTYVLLPGGGKNALSPDLERAAVDPTTQLIASRSSGRLAAGFPPTVLRTDQEGTITVPL